MTKTRSQSVEESSKINKENGRRGPRGGRKYFIQYRSNLLAFHRLMEPLEFKQQHLQQLRKTPFWNLLEAFISKRVSIKTIKKSDDNVLEILQTYKKQCRGFNLGKELLFLSKKDIALVFGIQCGDRKIVFDKTRRVETEFLNRRFHSIDALTAKKIKTELKNAMAGEEEQDFKDVARLLCLYLFATLFFAKTAQTVGRMYVPFIEDLESMKTYDWTTAIRDALMSSAIKFAKSPKKVTGCTIVLLYWLCEHTRILPPRDPEAFPRFIKWDLKELNKQMIQKSILQLKSKEIFPAELEETEHEKQAIYNNRGWQIQIYRGITDRILVEPSGNEHDEEYTEVQEQEGQEHEHWNEEGKYLNEALFKTNFDTLVDAITTSMPPTTEAKESLEDNMMPIMARHEQTGEIQQLERKIEDALKKNNELQKENEVTKKRMKELEAANEEINKEKEEMKNRILFLEDEKRKLVDEKIRIEEKKREIEEELQTRQAEFNAKEEETRKKK